jgi:coenzyme F420 hydrogenase subunit beta
LESGEIDGAVVTKLKYDGKKIVTYPFIARNRKEILSASGSHYLPVDFSKVIKKICQNEGEYAIVALPCVISNLVKAKKNLPSLGNRIRYLLGLFCSQNFNYSVLDFIKNKINLSDECEIKYFNFRSEWPDFVISLKTSEREYKLHPNFLFTLKMYTMGKCLICGDSLAELADISFGDAWLPKIKKMDRLGTNICVSRTAKGEKLLASAKKDGLIRLDEISPVEVLDSQKFSIYFKKVQGKYLRKKVDKFQAQLGISGGKLIPQFLITVPPCLLLSRLSNNHPELMAKIPSFVYKVIFYFVSLGVITWYKWGG